MRYIRKILGKGYYFFYYLYLRLLFWYPVWFYLLNREGHREYKRKHFSLNKVEKRIARDLSRDGIAVAHIEELFTKDVWRELLQYTNQLSQRTTFVKLITAKEKEPPSAKSDIIIHLLGGYGDTQPPLDVRDPFIRFATANTLVKIISSYLFVLPKFRMFSLHSTILLPPSAKTVFSQNWHRDPDDMKFVKVFLYLTDVDSKKSGPFIYVCGSHHGGKWRNIFPQRPPMGSYPPKEELESTVSSKDILVCTGRAGTIIFCDTSGLHRGGHSIGKRRIMFAGTYLTQAGLRDHKRNFKNVSSKAAMNSLSDSGSYLFS